MGYRSMACLSNGEGLRMKTESEFEKWFIEQHGERPCPKEKESILRHDVFSGRLAKKTLRECEIYDARKQSALYAWTALLKKQKDET